MHIEQQERRIIHLGSNVDPIVTQYEIEYIAVLAEVVCLFYRGGYKVRAIRFIRAELDTSLKQAKRFCDQVTEDSA